MLSSKIQFSESLQYGFVDIFFNSCVIFFFILLLNCVFIYIFLLFHAVFFLIQAIENPRDPLRKICVLE